MSTLQEIADSNQSWAAKRAQMALDIQAAFEQGDVSENEYKELLEDLIGTDALDAEADDIEMKAMLVQGISVLSKLV